MVSEMNRVNVVQYDPVVGFFPWYEFEASEWQDPAALEPNETVDLLGFRLTRLGDTWKVQRGTHTVTVTGNVMKADSPSKHVDDPDFTPDTNTEAEEGAVCGTVVNAPVTTSVVIARKNGTDCEKASEIAETHYTLETKT